MNPMKEIRFQKLFNILKNCAKEFKDDRNQDKAQYSPETILSSAFAVFFTQSESFLNYNRRLEEEHNQKHNLQSIFGVENIPSDNQIRNFLDTQEASAFDSVFSECYKLSKETGLLDSYKGLDGRTFIAIDGTQYFSSKNISCNQCLQTNHTNKETTFHHRMVTPVVTHPNMSYVLSLMPEFIVNDGDKYNKQDCEINASKRWLSKNIAFLQGEKAVILGDDLYSRQPFCKMLIENNLDYIFTCKQSSHTKMFETIEAIGTGMSLVETEFLVKNKKQFASYEFVNDIRITDEKDSLKSNFVKVSITDAKRKKVYKGAFITSITVTRENVAQIVAHARSRWKVENENNNVLKKHGYNLEHNFGHGKQNLSCILALLNIIAFLFHTLLDLKNEYYQKARQRKGARYNFFNAFAQTLNVLVFDSFEILIEFLAYTERFQTNTIKIPDG